MCKNFAIHKEKYYLKMLNLVLSDTSSCHRECRLLHKSRGNKQKKVYNEPIFKDTHVMSRTFFRTFKAEQFWHTYMIFA